MTRSYKLPVALEDSIKRIALERPDSRNAARAEIILLFPEEIRRSAKTSSRDK